jgi:hypothetical protein
VAPEQGDRVEAGFGRIRLLSYKLFDSEPRSFVIASEVAADDAKTLDMSTAVVVHYEGAWQWRGGHDGIERK